MKIIYLYFSTRYLFVEEKIQVKKYSLMTLLWKLINGLVCISRKNKAVNITRESHKTTLASNQNFVVSISDSV